MVNSYWKQYRSKIKDAKQGIDVPVSHKKNRKAQKKRFKLFAVYKKRPFYYNSNESKLGSYASENALKRAIETYMGRYWITNDMAYMYYIDAETNEKVFVNEN